MLEANLYPATNESFLAWAEISTSITKAAIDQTDTRELGFYLIHDFIPGETARTTALYYENDSGGLNDLRNTVTRTQTRSAVQSIETKTLEVKNPSALTIKFTYKFCEKSPKTQKISQNRKKELLLFVFWIDKVNFIYF